MDTVHDESDGFVESRRVIGFTSSLLRHKQAINIDTVTTPQPTPLSTFGSLSRALRARHIIFSLSNEMLIMRISRALRRQHGKCRLRVPQADFLYFSELSFVTGWYLYSCQARLCSSYLLQFECLYMIQVGIFCYDFVVWSGIAANGKVEHIRKTQKACLCSNAPCTCLCLCVPTSLESETRMF